MHLLSNKFNTDQGLKCYVSPFWFDFTWISYFHLNFVGYLIFTWWNQCKVLKKNARNNFKFKVFETLAYGFTVGLQALNTTIFEMKFMFFWYEL